MFKRFTFALTLEHLCDRKPAAIQAINTRLSPEKHGVWS